jgi:tellurite resistance-related uncharacterized protein/ribosomal protein S18 acetylase RimI-like enzyme
VKQLPAAAVPYRRTSEFDEQSVPQGLRRAHSTKPGVWGRIRVLEGRLLYRILPERGGGEEVELVPGTDGIIEPAVQHQVEPLGRVRFFVEFLSPEGIREAEPSQYGTIAACLARAFEDDPISRFIFPNDDTRARRLVSFYRAVLRMMSQHGSVYTDDSFRGAAVWRAPSPPGVGPLQTLGDGLRMVVALRTGLGRALALEQIVSQGRPIEPHWYLAILGTDPLEQGRGVGSSLLGPVLARCDREQLPAYLESSKEENISFYQRHGFRVTEELRVPDGPRLWSMVRPPPALNPVEGLAD